MNRNRILSLALAILLCLCTVALTGCAHKAPAFAELDFSAVDAASCVETEEVTDLVKISVAEYGDIIVRLYPKVAPKTVAHFQQLVSEKFYDGLSFHRVVINFMIQGGNPNGISSSERTIKGEFSENGFENNLKHIRGVISMARRDNDMNSATSQFFIVHNTSRSSALNGSYASFGYVVSGMDVVDAIANAPVKNNANGTEQSTPVTPIVIETIRFVKAAE